MSKPKFLAFDTETGGLDPNKNPILTAYFAVISEDYTVIDEIELYIRPSSPFDQVEDGAMKVNKINLSQHVERPDALTREQASQALISFLKKHKAIKGKGKMRPMGYNIYFDLGMIWAQLLNRAEWENYVSYANMDVKMIVDFYKDINWLPPELGKLESMVKHFSVPQIGAHNAKNDTIMMIDVYRNLMEMASNQGGNGLNVDILQLLEK